MGFGKVGWMLLLVLAVGTAGCSKAPEERARDHVARAERYLAEGDVEAGILELRNALELAEGDPEAWSLLGEANIRKGDFREAYRAFTRVETLAPGNLDAQLRLGNLFLLANLPERAREKAEAVLAADPQRAAGHLLLAKARLQAQDPTGAMAAFDEAIRLAPDQLDYRVDKASALEVAGELARAREELEEVLRRDGAHFRALALLAQVAERQQDWAGAEAAFARLIEHRPDAPGTWLGYGDYQLRRGRVEPALEAFRKAAGLDPKGISALERTVEVALSRDDLDAAREGVAAIRAVNSESLSALYYGARISLAERSYPDAVEAFLQVADERPEHAETQYFLGAAYYGGHQLQLAAAALRRAVELQPSLVRARLLLAQIHLDQGDYEEAKLVTEPLVGAGEVPVETVLIRASALLGLGEPGRARQLLEAVVREHPGVARVHELLGMCSLAEGHPDVAVRSFSDALNADPLYVRPLVLACRTLVGLQRVSEAIEMVTEHIAVAPPTSRLHVLLGRLYLGNGDKERAREELDRAVDLDADEVEAYMLLAQLHEGPDAVRKALGDVDRGLSKRADYVKGWVKKGTLHDRLGEFEAANEAYRKALALREDAVPALNNLAWNLAEHGGNLDEALKFAEKAVELSPDSPALNDTLGWIYVKKNAFLKAVSHLEFSAKGLEDNPVVHFHLGKAYAGMEQGEKAARALETALRISDSFPEAAEAKALLEKLRG